MSVEPVRVLNQYLVSRVLGVQAERLVLLRVLTSGISRVNHSSSQGVLGDLLMTVNGEITTCGW